MTKPIIEGLPDREEARESSRWRFCIRLGVDVGIVTELGGRAAAETIFREDEADVSHLASIARYHALMRRAV